MKHVNPTTSALAERSSIAYPSIYELVDPVRALRKKLGLTTNDVATLTALVSFLPRDRSGSHTISPAGMSIVFPSNASLSERANAMEERTLRRCLGRLEAVGLILRKNSANGKRFPLRYDGTIKDAFGIDLRPLIENHDALLAEATQLAGDNERLRSLKAEAFALHASLVQDSQMKAPALAQLGMIRNILRRTTTTTETVLEIIASLRKLGANSPESYGEKCIVAANVETTREYHESHRKENTSPAELSGCNGQTVRQIESFNKESIKITQHFPKKGYHQKYSNPLFNRDPSTMSWKDFTHIASLFPEAPHGPYALKNIILDVGKLLRISHDNLMHGLQNTSSGKILLLLNHIIGMTGTIRSPSAYFKKVLWTQMS